MKHIESESHTVGPLSENFLARAVWAAIIKVSAYLFRFCIRQNLKDTPHACICKAKGGFVWNEFVVLRKWKKEPKSI